MEKLGDVLKFFMEPRSVAVVGVSRKSGPDSFNLMENMLRSGFQGEVFPVNPHADMILGVKAYSRIREIHRHVDLAVITLPRDLVVPTIHECGTAGVKAAIVVGQGFADADAAGKRLQMQIAEIARAGGPRVLGPNTLGVVNNFNSFTTSFMPLSRDKAPIGLVCQSGLFFVGADNFTGKIGKGIDIGNACDVGFCECLEYLGRDREVEVIAVHMEGVRHGRKFLSIAQRVARQKPIVVFKTGESESGARAAASHSGSMAGDFVVCRTALRQAGLLFLHQGDKMGDAVRTLLHQPPLKGDRIAVITATGAGGIAASDALERYGLRLARLRPETLRVLGALSPEWMPLGNPLDTWPSVMSHGIRETYRQTLRAVLADPEVDGVLCISLALDPDEYAFLDASGVLSDEVDPCVKKPVVAWFYGPFTNEITEKFEGIKGLSAYHTVDRAAWALSLLRERARFVE